MVVCHVQATLDRVGLRGNTTDLSCQPFYKFIEKTYAWHVVGMFALLYAFGGFPAMVWGGALRVAWVYHITWFVNSASHVWGYQSYNTGASSLELVVVFSPSHWAFYWSSAASMPACHHWLCAIHLPQLTRSLAASLA